MPMDILLLIFTFFEQNEGLKHRLLFCAFGEAGHDTLVKLDTLYIHPEPSNLARVLKTCDNPKIAPNVKTIVFLGKAMNGPGTRTSYDRLDNHPWSQSFDVTNNAADPIPERYTTLRDLAKKPNRSFRDGYITLLEVLAKLSGASKLVYANSTGEVPGYNVVSDQTIDDWT